ncbi:MAG: poly(A) polymerase [Gammaproteobacteria bacterium]|nr:poly(A) polymerase [Gammaproteobacteria bacterium]
MFVNPEIFSANKFNFETDSLSKNALSVISRLHKKKFKAYIVGGGIRDLIEGIIPKDFDIVTDCEPKQIRKLFKNSRIIGRRFKLVHITFPNEVIEVTTFRSGEDPQSDSIQINDKGRIIRDNKWGTQEEDALRRDLTINSIYYDPFSEEIVDYTGGIKDLENKKIKLIGDAEKRIVEDPVRILRVIRFAAKLNFEIDLEIKNAITKHKNQLLEMSSARIYEEIIKMFLTGHAQKTYQLLQEYDLFDLLFPHIENSKEDFNEFYENAFKNTDQRIEENKKLNTGFLFATLLWPKIYLKSGISERIKYKSFYRNIASVLQKQQNITAIPRRYSSFIRDIWMNQIRFKKMSKKSINFTNSMRFRASYDFLLLRNSLEKNLETVINWWTDFKTANYDKKVKLLNEYRKGLNEKK